MASHGKGIWTLVFVLLVILLLALLNRQRYLEFSSQNSLHAEKNPDVPSKNDQAGEVKVDESIRAEETLNLEKQIQLKDEEIASLKETITKLQKGGSSKSTSNVLYNCNKGKVPPKKTDLVGMEYSKLAEVYHSYIENIQVACEHMVRMGKPSDGGWELCDDEAVRPKPNCLVYSFGISNDFSFDDAMEKHYGCEIHSFDPSMGVQDHKHSEKVMFHNLGLADFDGVQKRWNMSTLSTIRKKLKHSERTLDVLKIDIEKWEMNVLPEIIKTNALKDVNQIGIEMHVTLGKRKSDGTKEVYTTALGALRDLYDLGFRIFFTHRNRWSYFISKFGNSSRTACHEINMMKVC